VNKPYKITKLENDSDIERLDNLLTILFSQSQPKETLYKTLTGAGVWITVEDIGEKQLMLVENTTDNVRRLYTKINGTLRYVTWT
jgi:hypothetical protein